MMFKKNLKPVFFAILLCVLAFPAGANDSDKRAAVIEAHERTQAYIAEKNFAAALDSAEAAYELAADTLGENNLNTANLAINYARLLGPTGETRKAYRYYKKAVSILTTRHGAESIKVVPAMLGMAEFAHRDERQAIVKKALNIQRTEDPENKLDYAEAALYAGEYLAQHELNRELATKILKESLAIYRDEHGENSSEIIYPLLQLGNASARFADSLSAKRYYSRAIRIADKQLTEEKQARLLQQVGSALLQYSGSRDAKKYLKRSHQMFSKLFGDDDIRTAMSALELARFHLANKKAVHAEPLLIQSLGVVEKDPNYRNHQLSALSLLVESYERLGRRDEATPFCQAIGEITPWTNTQDYKPIFKKAPKYPASAISNGHQGWVLVEYTVDKYGFVQEPQIVESEGPKSLHAASLEASHGFRYAPAYADGKAVATSGVRNKFTFTLLD